MTWTRPQRLEIRRLIGQGWSGGVYLAADLDSAQPLAVRLISAELVAQVGQLTQVLQPGATLGLAHVLATSLPEAHEGQLFYTMPLAAAGSLATLLGRKAAGGPLPDPLTALDLARQMAEGLAAAHAQGVMHGNLKPENVLLWPRETASEAAGPAKFEVRLSDFGLNSLRVPDALSPYLSAEQRVGALPTVQDDLYGLGGLLFSLLTGQEPPLHPAPGDVQGLPDPLRKLLGRCFGWPAPFTDASSFLGSLRAVQRSLEVGLSRLGVQLTADTSSLQLTPGLPYSLPLRLAGQDAQVLLVVEGWPADWVSFPAPALHLRPGSETVCSAEFMVPREVTATPQIYAAKLLALDPQREVLARWPLHIEVLPFTAQSLELRAVGETATRAVTRTATLETLLKNEGNQTTFYNLEAILPPGSRLLRGSAGQQFELAPGAEYRGTLELELPLSLWQSRRHRVSLVAHNRTPGGTSWLPKQDSAQATAEVVQRPRLPWWSAALLLAGLAGATVWAAQAPRIEVFALKGKTPLRGEAFTLVWRTQGARQVQLLESPAGPLPSQGQRQMAPLNSAQTYTLVARSLLSQRSRQLTVSPVLPPPSLVTFRATPLRAKAGQSVSVQWNVQNVSEVQLSPFGKVPPRGTRQLVVTHDTPLELRAGPEGPQGVQSRLTITVGAPQINVFKVTPGRVRQGQPVTVSWQVSGATRVRLAPLGDLPESGTRTFIPAATGPLVLKASNGQQEVTSSAVVSVSRPVPTITAFSAVPDAPVVGQPLKLRWNAQGVRQVTLRWGDQQQVLPPGGELTLTTTAQMQNLSLVVQGADGPPVLKSLSLKVRPAPAVPARSAVQPAAATAGQGRAGQIVTGQPGVGKAEKSRTGTAQTGTGQTGTAQRGNSQTETVQTGTAQDTTVPAPHKAQATPAGVRIVAFYAQPSQAEVGQQVTLRWQVSGTGQVSLIGPDLRFIGQFGSHDSHMVTLRQAGKQTFRLVAGNEVAHAAVQVAARASAAARPSGAPRGSAPVAAGGGSTAQASPERPAAPKRSGSGQSSAFGRPVIKGFRAEPVTVATGQRTTLLWNVAGAQQVRISGLRGPNIDGTFPPVGQVRTPPVFRPVTYTLSAQQRQQSVRIVPFAVTSSGIPGQRPQVPAVPATPATRTAPARPGGAARSPVPGATRSASAEYAALAGHWFHGSGLQSAGQLNLQITGSRVTGILTSTAPDLPSGRVRGTLSGDGSSPMLNAFLTSGGERVALLIRFDKAAQTFDGFYSSRTNRVPWCGARTAGRIGCK